METVGELMVVITNRSRGDSSSFIRSTILPLASASATVLVRPEKEAGATVIPQLSTTDPVTLHCSEINLYVRQQ